jgi:outer membrane protein assembly factor BamB
VALFALLGACRREAPAGSGEAERPVEGMRRFAVGPSGALEEALAPSSARTPHTPRSADDFASVSGPANRFVLADVALCTLSSFTGGALAWRQQIPECGGLITVSLARDGTAYARTRTLLAAFGPSGEERWRLALADAATLRAAAQPTTLADSRVAVATSPTEVAVFSAAGLEAWRLRLPAEEPLVAAPRGREDYGLVLLTGSAAYFVGSQGELQHRHPHRVSGP